VAYKNKIKWDFNNGIKKKRISSEKIQKKKKIILRTRLKKKIDVMNSILLIIDI